MRSRFINSLSVTAFVLIGASSVLPANATSLDEALRAALANSLSLEASRNTWLAAREDIGTAISTSEWRATGSLVGTQKMTNEAAAKKSGFLDSQSATATVSLTKNLYDGGQTTETTRLRQIQLEIAEAGYRAAEQQVMLTVIESYLDVITAAREVELNERNVNRLSEHVAAARVRQEAGAATITQVAQSEARLSRARTTLISATTAFGNAEDRFTTLTAMPATDMDTSLEVGSLPETLLEADDLARKEHPRVRSANLAVDAANQQFHSLLASVRPTVALSLSASESMAEGTRSDKTEMSAQIRLSTPLMPTQSISAKSRSLSASLQSKKYDRDDTLRQISLDVRNAFRNLETARAQRGAVDAELEASRLVAAGITNEFQFGQKTALDVLDAEQDVNDAEIRQVNADHAILLSAFRLRAATGQLTSVALEMNDVLGPLEDMQPMQPRYKSWIPLEVEWEEPESEAAEKLSSAGSTVTPQPAPGVAITANDPLVLEVPVGDSKTASEQIKVVSVAQQPSATNGVVWQIQTAVLP